MSTAQPQRPSLSSSPTLRQREHVNSRRWYACVFSSVISPRPAFFFAHLVSDGADTIDDDDSAATSHNVVEQGGMFEFHRRLVPSVVIGHKHREEGKIIT